MTTSQLRHNGPPRSKVVKSTAIGPKAQREQFIAKYSAYATTKNLFLLATALRLVLFFYGLAQDALSTVKYTDIDYLVFTDAARLSRRPGGSPYERETYRYTPLLAWLLYPTTFTSIPLAFSSGKLLFAAADLLAGWFLLRILRRSGLSPLASVAYASIWLLNPMVATISTRGSSEGLLGAMVAGLVWAALERRIVLSGALLGLAVHFKIYPFIYAPAIIWWMDPERMGQSRAPRRQKSLFGSVMAFVTWNRIEFTLVSLFVFGGLNTLMFKIYGTPFVKHTYLHHITRLDHRHNFSPYNILLYLNSASDADTSTLRAEAVAFVPQLLLSAVLIPLVLAKKDLVTTMLAQTFAFVTFNKVCTSQYFLWYLVFLPLTLPKSALVSKPALGITAALLWAGSQAFWLREAYVLEFLGQSSFYPGLFAASLGFFLVNCWILGIIVQDGARAS